MTRGWNDLVAVLGDLLPGGVPVLAVALFLLTGLVSMLWFWWPAWLPTRWLRRSRGGRDRSQHPRRRWRFRRPRLGRLRFRWRWGGWRRRRPAPVQAADLPEDQLPDLPATVLALNADQLAAAGRYKEAVRERLRAVVRDLIERQVLAPVPGWTVTELAGAAGRALPPAAAPLGVASDVFSEIWYGLRPATADDDRVMREQAERVRAALGTVPAGVTP